VRFGRYDLLGRLATGGSAHVFLAAELSDRGRDRIVCVKTLIPERASNPVFSESFSSEAGIARHLHHPNCVAIHEVGEERGTPFISMEYVLGETLAALLETYKANEPLPIPAMVALVASICDGLHYAHELSGSDGKPYDLVHRDISPQNIMITYAGQVKVLDFGIAKAKVSQHDTKTNVIKGKLHYMSPEQIFAQKVDRRSDLYSLGLVLFECLTGTKVYAGCNMGQVQFKMIHEAPPRARDVNPDIDARLDEICATAMSMDPGKRYPTAYSLGRDLRAFLAANDHPAGREPIGTLMRQRFAERGSLRQDILERALAGAVQPSDLRTAFGARPVLMIDLYGEIAPGASRVETRADRPREVEDAFDDDATLLSPGGTTDPHPETFDELSITTAPRIDTPALWADSSAAVPLPTVDPREPHTVPEGRAEELKPAPPPPPPDWQGPTKPSAPPPVPSNGGAPAGDRAPTGKREDFVDDTRPGAPKAPPVESTRKVAVSVVEAPPRWPVGAWLFGFAVGLATGVVLTLLFA
jgi:serine/threonine protein kinase